MQDAELDLARLSEIDRREGVHGYQHGFDPGGLTGLDQTRKMVPEGEIERLRALIALGLRQP